MYPLVYAVPALMVAAIAMVVATVAIAGVLWVFVFGDDTWPSFVRDLAPVFMATVLGIGWLVLLAVAYRRGRQEEARGAFDRKHLLVSAGAAAGLVLLVLLHQRSVGNIGPRSDSLACNVYCSDKGFAASRFPQDGTCRCMRVTGPEVLNVPMDDVRAAERQRGAP